VVAAASADVAAVEGKLLGAEADGVRLLIDRRGDVDAVAPRGGWMDVDLDDARVGRHLDYAKAGIVGRGVAFEPDGLAQIGGGSLDGSDQHCIVDGVGERRQEHA
jgi:hypothetical protein